MGGEYSNNGQIKAGCDEYNDFISKLFSDIQIVFLIWNMGN